MQKKLMILFPEGNLPYSPTTLNLIKLFENDFNVFIISQNLFQHSTIEESGTLITLSDKLQIKTSIFKKFGYQVKKLFIKSDSINYLSLCEKKWLCEIKQHVEKIQPDIIIAVDLFALYCCKQIDRNCIFLSLEIPTKSTFYNSLFHKKIDCVIIQSKERFDYLFERLSKKPSYFILPNAPVFQPLQRRTEVSKKLIYNGFVWSAFGPQFCMGFVSKYPEYELYIKGGLHIEDMVNNYYPYLLHSPKFAFDEIYLEQEELNKFLSQFSLGFCFYNFKHPFISENEFNYQTAPSGKLFNYLSIGMPVVCSNIEAFKFIEEEGAGILINDYSPESIKKAVDLILSNYKIFSDNAIKLGQKNCFKENLKPICDYLNSKYE